MELKLSDEQYEKIGRESVAEWQKSFHPNTKSAYIAVGRNAVELSNAEVLPAVREEIRKLSYPEHGRSDLWVFTDAIDSVFASFTASADAAVKAVLPLLDKVLRHEEAPSNIVCEVVAAVRAADREAER